MPFATNAKQTVFRPRSNTEKCTLSSVCQEKTDVRRNLASALTGKLKTRPWYLSDLNLVLGIFSSGRDSAIWWAPISRMPICLVFCTERICIIPPCQAHGTLPIPISKISHRLEFLPMKTCPYSLCRSWNLFTEWPERRLHSWTVAMSAKYTSCLASQSSAWNHTSRAHHCSLSKACLDPHSGLIIPVGASAEEMG